MTTASIVFDPGQYELLDFGDGRKLERFGAVVLDRPSPAAEELAVADPHKWASATARFAAERGRAGTWDPAPPVQEAATPTWTVAHGKFRLTLQPGPSGNIGVFPEHSANWGWIADRVREQAASRPEQPARILNLFGYTGAASLAAAAAGAEVTHVDSAGPTVAWAKRNAADSGLEDRPIRWIVEDAMKFVAREVRRGNRYDGIIADPPTYGHGPKGRPFKFRDSVDELIGQCAALLDQTSTAAFFVFTCHTPGFGSGHAVDAVSAVLPGGVGAVDGFDLELRTADGRALPAGVCARWRSH